MWCHFRRNQSDRSTSFPNVFLCWRVMWRDKLALHSYIKRIQFGSGFGINKLYICVRSYVYYIWGLTCECMLIVYICIAYLPQYFKCLIWYWCILILHNRLLQDNHDWIFFAVSNFCDCRWKTKVSFCSLHKHKYICSIYPELVKWFVKEYWK